MGGGEATASYFDADYFEAGHRRGTRYANYLRDAMESPIYRGMAEAILAVFRPSRVLEVGCASGPIVAHLNDLGCEAHGIDVSEWAVEHRFHPNVLLAGADDLPFDDDAFDLVFSSHALEHLPDAIIDRCFSEMSRVAARHQFHMHPILGIPPYDGPREPAIACLRSDPTHVQLHELPWWRDRWGRLGWHAVPANILLDADNAHFEFSTCQLLLSRLEADAGLLESIHEYNRTFFRRVSSWTLRGQGGHGPSGRPSREPVPMPVGFELAVTGADGPPPRPTLSIGAGAWADLVHAFPEAIDLREASLSLVCRSRADAPLTLRVAAVTFKPGSDTTTYAQDRVSGVAQATIQLPPGDSAIRIPIDEFELFYGSPRPDQVGMIFIGGEHPTASSVACSAVLELPSGTLTLFEDAA